MSLSGTVTGRERASGHGEQHRWPGMPAAGEHSGRTAPSRAAFWLVAGVLCLLFFAAGAPSPLYGIYRAWVPAVLGDHADRRLRHLRPRSSPTSLFSGRCRTTWAACVILTALTVTAGACTVFLAAHSVGLLFAARALQGVAVGTATGALARRLSTCNPRAAGSPR